jgi:hypothetical protein
MEKCINFTSGRIPFAQKDIKLEAEFIYLLCCYEKFMECKINCNKFKKINITEVK